ncbi:Wadjet anti-phage system protein JetD domain-containing protein [Kitasatospora cineracea]|uniref:Wadjet anti-phage system protein JetD domain-containing protein n=1 Tax=Kitasatospora cineracea TaxID=88074 RepID=UPI00378A701A
MGQRLLFGEAYGRLEVSVDGVPSGLRAVTIPVKRSGEARLPRDRRRRLRVQEVDLVADGSVGLFEPPAGLAPNDLLWVLRAERRSWDVVTRRFGVEAEQMANALVRCGGVVLRREVDELLALGRPIRWCLTESWSQQAPERMLELLGAREPRRARAELLAVLASVANLDSERGLLEDVPDHAGLVVPESSRSGTRAWSVYEAAVRAAAEWWTLRAQGEEEVTLKQLAASTLGGSKRWTPQQQVAFANLLGMEFEEAVHEEETDLRVKGPLSWSIGEVAADASVARPWVGLPARGLRLVGQATCWAEGILVIENSDTFGAVCRRLPELTARWLCVWGRGYVSDQLVALLAWLPSMPVAAWCDLDADGIAIVHGLAGKLGRPVHAVGMEAAEWRRGPYRKRKDPEADRAADRKLAAELAGQVADDLRELALAVAASGESFEQENQYTSVLPRLPELLTPLLEPASTDPSGTWR